MPAPNILLITTDQQRFDSLACNGNALCATPNIDGLARHGINFTRAHTQYVQCTPSRSTILTGQYPASHGVWCNGVPLPRTAPSVATELGARGYQTTLIGKAHFETFDPQFTAYLRSIGETPVLEVHQHERDGTPVYAVMPPATDWYGPHRGFDHVEVCDSWISGHHGIDVQRALGDDLAERFMTEAVTSFFGAPGGDTGAPQAYYSELAPELHSSAWIARRAEAWFDRLDPARPFFAWLSFDDPHHPFNPPAAYGRRHDRRTIPLPPARPPDHGEIDRDLAGRPPHYLEYWRNELEAHEGSATMRPADLTNDQLREITALTYGMVELVDEQVGVVLDGLRRRGLLDTTHVFFTTDHGELLGDHGLILKGPFHLDGLVHIPLIWRPPSGVGRVVADPVGLVDLAPTFCALAGGGIPEWMESAPLPERDGTRERVITVFDSQFDPTLKIRSEYRDGWFVSAYPERDGVGELYCMDEDPYQFVNRWDDAAVRTLRDDLVADVFAHTPEDRRDERLACWAIA